MKKVPLVLVSSLLSNETLWQGQIDHLRGLAPVQIVCPQENTAEKMVQALLEQAPPLFCFSRSLNGRLALLRGDAHSS